MRQQRLPTGPDAMTPPRALPIKIDPAELAVRIYEAAIGIKRPVPDPKEILAALDESTRSDFLRAARAAADYFAEVAAVAQKPQTKGH